MIIKRKLLIIAISLCAFLQLLILGCSISSSEIKYQTPISKNIEEVIKNPKIKVLEETCKNMPSFRDYNLKDKRFGKNKIFVTYIYTSATSDRVDYSQLKEFYDSYLLQNGWEVIASSDVGSKWTEYSKDKVYLMISTSSDMSDGRNYAIECLETSYSGIQ